MAIKENITTLTKDQLIRIKGGGDDYPVFDLDRLVEAQTGVTNTGG